MRMQRVLFIVAIAALARPGVRGQADQPSAKTPTYRSTARTVVVDVVVAKGDEPVKGLQRQDFSVLEDGKPQAIDFFEEHSANTLPAGALPPLPKMPPGVYTNVPSAPPNDSVNVLLLDALNTDQGDQTYVHNQIIRFLKNMQPGTRAAIFTLSKRLRMVQGFTTDSSALVAALNDPKFGDMITKPAESRSMQDKKDDVWELEKRVKMDNGHVTAGIEELQGFQSESTNMESAQRVGMTLQALQILARYLAAVPGRKNLIWFSSSFPVTVFPQAERSQPNQMDTSDLRDYGKAIRGTADMLTVAKVAVYPVGAEGVMSEHVQDADIESLHPGPVDYEGGDPQGGRMTPYVHENGARSDKIMAMEQLAIDTGGKAFYNTNDLSAATQKAIADGAHYYTLAYAPTNKKMDGSFRRIQVKVAGGKYRVAYRHGYNADDNARMGAGAIEGNPLHALMMRGMPDATQILYAARVLPANPQPAAGSPRAGKNAKLEGPTTRYSIDFMIRWTDVKLDTQPDGTHNGKIELQLMAYDRDGNALNWAGGTQAMKLTPELFVAIEKSGVPAHFEIDLPSEKDVFLETGVYDEETGKAGTMEVALPASRNVTAKASSPDQTR